MKVLPRKLNLDHKGNNKRTVEIFMLPNQRTIWHLLPKTARTEQKLPIDPVTTCILQVLYSAVDTLVLF